MISKLNKIAAGWLPPLSRSEAMEFDRENTDINCKRIFIYSFIGIFISGTIFIIIQLVFKHRQVYLERESYFSRIELFHMAHIALSFIYIAAYLTVKKLGSGNRAMKIAQNAAIVFIAPLYVYMSTISNYYHGDLVFYAVMCSILAVALYLKNTTRAALYLSTTALMLLGLLAVLRDSDLFVIKTTNVLIISAAGFILSMMVYRFRLREFHHKSGLIKTNLQLMHDLDSARSMQKRLIPAAPPATEGVSIFSLYRPMEMVGGDFFDFIPFRKNATGIFISDVSGHGVTASLITGMIKTLIDTAEQTRSHPGSLLNYINSRSNGLLAGNFLTAVYGIIDTADMTFTYSRGGHTLPLLLRDDGIEELESSGIFMGVYKNLMFEERTVSLQQGDRILLYTDGLTEATDNRGKFFQDIFMHDVLPGIVNLKTGDFVQHIYRELVRFTGEETFDDDICMVGAELARRRSAG